MNTKKCSRCGWEFPATYPGRTCKFCKGPILNGYCYECGQWSEKLRVGVWLCRECETRQHKEWRMRRRYNAENSFKDWLQKINSIPTPYKTLTEEEWLDACKHFGTCAYCGKGTIESRSMFIPFKEGGRYCVWNIVPACEQCETLRKANENPFLRMDSQLNSSKSASAIKYGFSLDKLQKITDYLGGKM